METFTKVELSAEERNELLKKVQGARNVRALQCKDIILHRYFFDIMSVLYYNNTSLGEVATVDFFSEGVLMLTDEDSDMCFLRLADMKQSSWFCVYETIVGFEGVFLLTYPDGDTCIFCISTMEQSNWLRLDTYELVVGVEGILILTDDDGDKCFFRLADMEQSDWLTFETYEPVEGVEGMLLLTDDDGDKCFFRLADMEWSCWLTFETYKPENDGTITLTSRNGTTATFDTESMETRSRYVPYQLFFHVPPVTTVL